MKARHWFALVILSVFLGCIAGAVAFAPPSIYETENAA